MLLYLYVLGPHANQQGKGGNGFILGTQLVDPAPRPVAAGGTVRYG